MVTVISLLISAYFLILIVVSVFKLFSSKKTLIKLTLIETVLTEEAEDKVLKHYESIAKDQESGEEDEWDRMGIKRPEWAEKKDPEEPKLEDEDFVQLERTVLVEAKDIAMVEELDDNEGSKVYLKSQYTVTVKEKPEEIEKLKSNLN